MKVQRLLSILLSMLMVCSIFSGLSVSAYSSYDDEGHTYTVVGEADFLGAMWDPSSADDDMTLQADGTYKKTYTGVDKSDLCTIKVVQDHSWDVNFGATLGKEFPANIEFSVPEDN